VEVLLGKAGHDRIFESDEIGGVLFAVQRHQLAEIFIVFAVIECHFAAREGKIDDARTTFDDEIKVATVTGRLITCSPSIIFRRLQSLARSLKAFSGKSTRSSILPSGIFSGSVMLCHQSSALTFRVNDSYVRTYEF
jgi:hypothetical protein